MQGILGLQPEGSSISTGGSSISKEGSSIRTDPMPLAPPGERTARLGQGTGEAQGHDGMQAVETGQVALTLAVARTLLLDVVVVSL